MCAGSRQMPSTPTVAGTGTRLPGAVALGTPPSETGSVTNGQEPTD